MYVCIYSGAKGVRTRLANLRDNGQNPSWIRPLYECREPRPIPPKGLLIKVALNPSFMPT